jgi:hypothetical protein
MFVVVEHIYETAEGARNSNLLYRQQNRVRSHNANNTYTCLTKFALRHFHPLKKGKGNKHHMQIQDSTLTRKKENVIRPPSIYLLTWDTCTGSARLVLAFIYCAPESEL